MRKNCRARRRYSQRDASSSDSKFFRSHSRRRASDSEEERPQSRHLGRGGVHSRKPGRKHPHLRILRPSNHLFDMSLNYRYYQLQRRGSSRTSRETGKGKDDICRLGTAVADIAFDGTVPITVLGFLTRFTEEADVLEIKESKALMALPYYLRGEAMTQIRATQNSSTSEGGIREWPEAVQGILRYYTTDNTIATTLLEIRDLRQKPSEDEASFSLRMMTAELRCGNIQSAEEKKTPFIDGFIPSICLLVARHHEEQLRCSRKLGLFTYLDLVRFAQDKE